MVGLLNTGETGVRYAGFSYITKSIPSVDISFFMFQIFLTASAEFLRNSADLFTKLKDCQ
jgi:hypothetical protein